VNGVKALTTKPVIGIFEASIAAAVQLLQSSKHSNIDSDLDPRDISKEVESERFGIISTGDIWKSVLGDAVRDDVLGPERAEMLFAGVETCGLNAGDLHGHEEVEERVKSATKRLMAKGDVGVVVLGCAGMVGMEEWVRSVAGEGVRVVDGVRAGVGVLQGLVRGAF